MAGSLSGSLSRFRHDTIDRAQLDAFRFVEMSHAFDASIRIDFVSIFSGADRFGWALGPARVTVNAIVQDN